MKKIRDAQTVIGLLEDGQLQSDLSAEITELLANLRAQSSDRPKSTIKGEIKLTLCFEVENATLEVTTKIETKSPKSPRARSLFWVTEDGSITTEHPRQQDMFSGPRVAADA